MKKAILLYTMVLILVSCSKSDSTSVNNTTESNLKINGVSFFPGTNNNTSNYVVTSYEAGVLNGDANSRFFGFNTDSQAVSELESLQIEVVYSSTQTNGDGTYSLTDLSNFSNYAQGSFSKGLTQYSFTSGSVIISDIGNNKFKVEFNNAVLVNFEDSTDVKTLTGYYKGTFIVDSN